MDPVHPNVGGGLAELRALLGYGIPNKFWMAFGCK